jgi:hypothetical protein
MGSRPLMPHGGAETAAHGAVARDDDKGGPQEMTVRRAPACSGFGVEANTQCTSILRQVDEETLDQPGP